MLVVCTGNAVRSVMAGLMIDRLAAATGAGVKVSTAGTHAVDGMPVGMRTHAALKAIGPMADVPVGCHRSRQLRRTLADRADLLVTMEADHVRYVRRAHPGAARRTATLRRLCRDLSPGPAPLAERVALMDLANVELSSGEDVVDPAGHDDDVYLSCAVELWDLCRQLVPKL